MKVFIYSLNCPFTSEVKYVGKTKNTLVSRLSAHMSCTDKNFEKRLWIKSLLAKNTKPTINLLEIVNPEEVAYKESYWITYFISKGVVLLNKVEDLSQKERALTLYRNALNRLQYRENTKKVYIPAFVNFLNAFEGFKYPEIKHNEIIQYLEYLVREKKISHQHQNTIINAIKFYFEVVLGGERKTYYIARPRKTQKIRPILSSEQVVAFLKSITNLKQKTVFQVMYSGALRTSEVVSLLTSDLNRENCTYFVRDAKGGKDRFVDIPKPTISMIDTYIAEYKPAKYLFAGQYQGTHYSSKSVQIKFEQKIKELGYDEELTPHCLRHSRISHNLNNGVKLEMASKNAGHSNVNITSKTYHHYDHEEMHEQIENADRRMMEKMNKKKLFAASQKEITAPHILSQLPIGQKQYQILFNGKTFLLKVRDNKIIDAPEGARWSIGVLTEKALKWFQSKGATISELKTI